MRFHPINLGFWIYEIRFAFAVIADIALYINPLGLANLKDFKTNPYITFGGKRGRQRRIISYKLSSFVSYSIHLNNSEQF